MNTTTNTMSGFAWVMNPIEVKCTLPYEIIPGHFFRKATPEEIDFIKSVYKDGIFSQNLSVYESIPKNPSVTSDGSSVSFESLGQKDWRYYVISFELGEVTNNAQADDIFQKRFYLKWAANLHPTNLFFEQEFFPTSLGFIGANHSVIGFFLKSYAQVWAKNTSITQQDLIEIGKLFNKIKSAEANHPDINRAIETYYHIKSLPSHSPLVALGLFSSIECVIAHQPEPKDSTDSLTRQIKHKIPLLNKRFSPEKLDYSVFNNANEDTIWSKLYAFRSCVAHGTPPESHKDTPLKILKNQDTILKFLHQAVRLLLRQALEEPELIMDLKQC